MGALRRKMPVTFWTFIVGTLALAGVWPFSGFFSKDSIIARALAQPEPAFKYGFFILAVLVSMLTAFYMFRLVLVVFFTNTRTGAADHAHESPSIMLWPLRILAVFSVIGGFIGIETLYYRQFSAESEAAPAFLKQLFLPFIEAPAAAGIGLLAAALGILGAFAVYRRASADPLPEKLGGLSKAMRDRFYFDELYDATVVCLHDKLARVAGFIDEWVIDGFCVGLVRGGTDFAGKMLRRFQTGNVQTYTLLFALGVAFVLYLALR